MTLWNSPWCWERLRAEGEEGVKGWDGWIASPCNEHALGQTPGDGKGQGCLVCCSPWGRKELDKTGWLNKQTNKQIPLSLSILKRIQDIWASQVALVVKNLSTNAGDKRDSGLIPGSERSPGGGHGNSLYYSCLENPTNRGAWRATVHGVAKSWTCTWHAT